MTGTKVPLFSQFVCILSQIIPQYINTSPFYPRSVYSPDRLDDPLLTSHSKARYSLREDDTAAYSEEVDMEIDLSHSRIGGGSEISYKPPSSSYCFTVCCSVGNTFTYTAVVGLVAVAAVGILLWYVGVWV